MNRLDRWCALMLLVLGAYLLTAFPAQAATTTATIQQGPLTITPAYVTLIYHAAARGSERTIASSFSVTITDARGTKAGWDIRATTISTSSPSGNFPTDAHVITDFNISFVNGTPPDPTGPSDIIPTTTGMILHNRPDTGMGQSTEVFSTQLTLPTEARGGTYSATLLLTVAPLGSINPIPPARPPSVPTGPGTPTPSPTPNVNPAPQPSSRTNTGPAVQEPGTPNPIPVSRPVGEDLPTTASNPSGNAASTTQGQSVIRTSVASPTTRPATTDGDANANTASAIVAAPTVPSSNVQLRATNTPAQVNTTVARDETATAPDAPAPSNITGNRVPVGLEQQPVTSSNFVPNAATNDLPSTATNPTFPVIALGRDTMTLTLPFASSLYDPMSSGPGWYLQTMFDLPNASTHPVFSTVPIRTNSGHLFSAVVSPETNLATITFNPLLATPDSVPTSMGPAILIVTIVAGP